jgi:hypothetical protein
MVAAARRGIARRARAELLYHVLASPAVHPLSQERAGPRRLPDARRARHHRKLRFLRGRRAGFLVPQSRDCSLRLPVPDAPSRAAPAARGPRLRTNRRCWVGTEAPRYDGGIAVLIRVRPPARATSAQPARYATSPYGALTAHACCVPLRRSMRS